MQPSDSIVISQLVATSSPPRSNEAAPARPVASWVPYAEVKGRKKGCLLYIYGLPVLSQLVGVGFEGKERSAALPDFPLCPWGMALRSLSPLIGKMTRLLRWRGP